MVPKCKGAVQHRSLLHLRPLIHIGKGQCSFIHPALRGGPTRTREYIDSYSHIFYQKNLTIYIE